MAGSLGLANSGARLPLTTRPQISWRAYGLVGRIRNGTGQGDGGEKSGWGLGVEQ